MPIALKSDERLIQALRLPISLLFAPVAPMRGEAIHEFMMTQVLRRLIAVTCTWTEARRAHQRQANRSVVRFVGSVLAIRQHGHAESAALIRQIDPLSRW